MIDSELGRISAQIINPISFPLQPKERIHSIGFLTIETKMCSQLSYRNAAEMINLVYHKTGSDAIKLRTLSDTTIRTDLILKPELSMMELSFPKQSVRQIHQKKIKKSYFQISKKLLI